MKPNYLIICLTSLWAGALPLAGATWLGIDKSPPDGEWWNYSYQRSINWDTNVVPNVTLGDSAIINNGDIVNIRSRYHGHYRIDQGGILLLDNQSSLMYGGGTQPPFERFIISNGSATVKNSSKLITLDTPLIMGAYDVLASSYASTLAIEGQSSVDLLGSVVMGAKAGINATIQGSNTINISGGHLWAGGNFEEWTNPGLMIYDYSDQNMTYRINFIGDQISTITLGDSENPQNLNITNKIWLNYGQSGQNPIYGTWEDLWDLGILTAEGRSGLTGHNFDNYFITYYQGTNPLLQQYILRYSPIPEPSALILTLTIVMSVAIRRHPRIQSII